ncbi:procathepsin L-like [Perognathus longimembris pacificus]|uniref:procathepsin L-like n=1 Tax=Perognathus longimembris pacificus TaxID=214514 RepID=UPI0020191066|nr:procathepsin L-like [Perognathus longimembris pacificus]
MDPCLLLAILCLGMASAAPTFDPSLDTEWTEWKTKYGKSYNSDEDIFRRAIWEENYKMIAVHNEEYSQGKHSYTMEINAFGDMTTIEFNPTGSDFQPDGHNEGQMYPEFLLDELPASVDWREKGYVSHVKDQGNCGSCWTFTTTGALEGQMFKKTGKLVSLSEQNLMDCSKDNYGCDGGRPDWAYQYIKKIGGLDSEESYPYEARVGPCRYNPEKSVANVTGFINIPPNEKALMHAVATVGPIAAGVHSLRDSFKYYKGGLYHDQNCARRPLTHAVLIVGYGYEGEKETATNKYWLIKNSWGKSWGVNGYGKLARDQNNLCGIASWTLYPTV